MKAKTKAKAPSKTSGKPSIPGPSPSPMTNLIIVDLVLKAGTRVLRHSLERGVLGTKYSPDKARAIVKSRTMTQTLVGTAVARSGPAICRLRGVAAGASRNAGGCATARLLAADIGRCAAEAGAAR